MSVILAVLDSSAARNRDEIALRMLERSAHRGAQLSSLWSEGSLTLGVTRHDWELKAGFAGPVFVVQDGHVCVAADATLYYRDDLRKRLADRGESVAGQTPSHLIAAAYRAWGARCAEFLEGDFAYVIWDRHAKQLVASRDFAGKRPLYHAALAGGGIAFSSSIDALRAHPGCSTDLDLRVIAESMAAYIRPGGATCYTAIRRLEAGRTAVRKMHPGLRIIDNWEPPLFERPSRAPTDEAAAELLSLIQLATGQRLATNTPTAVWMSGGRDSTAVFLSAMSGAGGRKGATPVLPVSVSYPSDDPECEDEYIRAVTKHWRTSARWLDIREIPFLDEPEERARRREEPFSHVFDSPLRVLSRVARDAGARVALDGVGGDQLFSVSCVYFSDLLRSGRWATLAREWTRAGFGGAGVRAFVRWAVQPAAPNWLLRGAGFVRGGHLLGGALRRRLPEWVDPAFARRHDLESHVRVLPRRHRGESVAASESRWCLTDPFPTTVQSALAQVALSEGIEIRSPLMDRRIVAFAASRPRHERQGAGQSKVLLRQAMRGLLPPEVIAERERRAGRTWGFALRALREMHDWLLVPVFRRSHLVELGVVDPAALEKACAFYHRTGDAETGLSLLLTLQAELWIRSHDGREDATHDASLPAPPATLASAS